MEMTNYDSHQFDYWNSVVAIQSSMKADLDDMLQGNINISIETMGVFKDEFVDIVQNNPAFFLKNLRYLRPSDQELLISYYIVMKAQQHLAIINKSTQTICSYRLRMACRIFTAFVYFKGFPSEEQIRGVLAKANLSDVEDPRPLNCAASQAEFIARAITLYNMSHDFQQVANRMGAHRPSIRRSFSQLRKKLEESEVTAEQALSALVFHLIDKANAWGGGLAARELKKQGTIMLKDPPVLGKFRVKAGDPYFEAVSSPKADFGVVLS